LQHGPSGCYRNVIALFVPSLYASTAHILYTSKLTDTIPDTAFVTFVTT
jgi:hypothetical protein